MTPQAPAPYPITCRHCGVHIVWSAWRWVSKIGASGTCQRDGRHEPKD